MTIDTARLRELAMKATPGKWTRCQARDGQCGCGLVWSSAVDWTVAHTDTSSKEEGVRIEKSQIIANGDYIAALSPDVVIELLDELESLRAERQAAEDSAKPARPGKYPSHMSEAEKAITLQIPMGDKP